MSIVQLNVRKLLRHSQRRGLLEFFRWYAYFRARLDFDLSPTMGIVEPRMLSVHKVLGHTSFDGNPHLKGTSSLFPFTYFMYAQAVCGHETAFELTIFTSN